VHPSRPYRSLADVVAAAKAKPDSITFASIGSGSVGHLTMVLLTQKAGIRLVHVPYRGGGPAMTDALAGHVDMIIGSAALVNPQVSAKAIIPIVQTGKTRLASMPEVPTAIESGFPGFESYAWWGVFTPAGTPKPIVERFSKALAEGLRDEAVAKQLRENLQITMLLAGPEEERKFLADQIALWGPVVRDNNIKSD
jgi:tripartite-type tricarboxylate transporter receptor subunit TctC